MSKQKTASIDNAEDLSGFLNSQARLFHKKYFHYTSFEAFKAIISNKTFQMSRGDSESLNDRHEAAEKMPPLSKKKTYFSCYTYGDYENFSMWGLYGSMGKGVRIEIPRESIEKMLKSRCK